MDKATDKNEWTPLPDMAQEHVGQAARQSSYHHGNSSYEAEGLPPFSFIFRPLVSAVARLNTSVHIKLLSGFLLGALLLLGMAVLSLVVISRMSDQVGNLNRLQERMDQSRQMEYLLTSQSHFRAMALLTDDDSNNVKIDNAKQKFAENLDYVQSTSRLEHADLFAQIEEANSRFDSSSANALSLYEAGNSAESLDVHLGEEHPITHELEVMARELIRDAENEMAQARAEFESGRALLTTLVLSFSAVSVVLATLLGFILSWAFILPVRKINNGLMKIADGDFGQQVEVENRDEFGMLSKNLNSTSDQLATLYDKLEFELVERKQLTDTLQHRTVELAAINSELESFSYSVSHDLKAPLRSMDGFSQALIEDHGDQLDEEGKDYLQRVRAASQRMGQLIDDLLHLTRVTRSEMSREQIGLSDMATTIASELRESEPERNTTFTIAEGVVADGDGHLLRNLLENLLGNAWKYTRKRPESHIEFGVNEEAGKSVYFVRDNGAGFDMAHASKLFTPFQRLHSSAEFEGTGIGLATVKRIINRHGGRVWAEIEIDHGATFFFMLS